VEYLKSINPDVIIVFGTGKINSSLIQIPRLGCLNLHGGDPERYRGLDTHLWAIYHQEFDQLITTLHYIDETLDTGDVVFKATLPISRGLQLHQLRAVNTQVCVKLSLLALMGLHKNEWLPSMKHCRLDVIIPFCRLNLKRFV
jgi:methionyl-tRNA formyltransferase